MSLQDRSEDLELLLRRIIREEAGITPVTPAQKWRGGTLVLRPGTPGLQEKIWPIETFFHKVVMLRNRLRTLEQQVNASDLPEDVKVKLQGYVSGCYGSLTSFNVFRTGEGSSGAEGGGPLRLCPPPHPPSVPPSDPLSMRRRLPHRLLPRVVWAFLGHLRPARHPPPFPLRPKDRVRRRPGGGVVPLPISGFSADTHSSPVRRSYASSTPLSWPKNVQHAFVRSASSAYGDPRLMRLHAIALLVDLTFRQREIAACARHRTTKIGRSGARPLATT